MKKILFLILLISFYPLSSFSETYDCEIAYWGSDHPSLQKWLPSKFNFSSSEKNIFIKDEIIDANIKLDSPSRIEMNFNLHDNEKILNIPFTRTNVKDLNHEPFFPMNLVYLKKINKFILTLSIGHKKFPNSGKCKTK